MKKLLVIIATIVLSFSALHAEDERIIIHPVKSTNYALYYATDWVCLRLDTRDGTLQAIELCNPKKNRILNSQPLATEGKPGRFELQPTHNPSYWILFDTENGDMWDLSWRNKKNPLMKIPVNQEP